MMNNNTQVSLRNGANFSRIRMALKGMRIPKFKTPAGAIELWFLNRYANNSALGGWNSSLDASRAGSTIVGAGNSSQHGKAGDLNAVWSGNLAYTANSERVGQDILYWVNEWIKQHPNATKEQIVEAYNQIALLIRDYLQLRHTYNSIGASTNNRNFRTMFSSRSLKSDPNADMSSDLAFIGYQDEGDDIYGSSSFLRRMDLYEKEYDALTEDEKTGRTHTIRIGDLSFKVYKKANGDIALLNEDGNPNLPLEKDLTTPPGPPEKEPPVTTPPYTWDPVEYEGNPSEPTKLGKWRFPTFPLYNGALHGIASLTNKRVLDTKLKAPAMRYLGWDPYAKVTDAYATRSGNLQALQEYNWGMRLSINNSSDLGKRNEMEEKLRNAELLTKLQNNQDKMGEFNQTTQNFINTENLGKQIRTNVGNQNMQSYVADARDRLNTIAQYQAQQGLLDQENVMANYTDWKAWNRNNQLQDYADWRANEYLKVQQDYQKAYDNFKNSGDLSKYQGYTDFWNNQYASGIAGLGNPKNDRGSFAAGYATFLGKNGQDTDANRLKFFKEHMNDEAYKSEMEPFIEEWNKYKSDAQQTFLNNRTQIGNRWGLINARYNPINFTGENSAWLWRYMNPAPSYKSIYSMKGGGRFLEYLKHNRRAEKEIRDTTMKSMQESRKMLKRDLDALDRESLLLLRAIFK